MEPAPPESWRATLDLLRDRHQVRSLRTDEEGFSIARLPNGVRGFTYAPGQPEVPVFAHKTYHSFEVHKAADGTEYMIGFVTPSEAEQLDAGVTHTATAIAGSSVGIALILTRSVRSFSHSLSVKP